MIKLNDILQLNVSYSSSFNSNSSTSFLDKISSFIIALLVLFDIKSIPQLSILSIFIPSKTYPKTLLSILTLSDKFIIKLLFSSLFK